jgi:glycosyltransferase involved in cell wall biosynthesis
MATEIDSRSYDFVFVHHDRLVQSPYLLRYLRTPSVYYCAEPMRQFYEPTIRRAYLEPASFFDRAQRIWYGPAVSARNRMIRDVDARNVHHATLLLTNSYFSAESIYRAYGLRARVCYLGVDTARFRPLGRERDNVVLSVGAVSPMKGYDFLIESIGLLPREHRPALVIVGNTSSAAETCYLNEMARQRGVAIRYEIDVSEDELVGWYNRVRAFVYAPVLEPFGLAPIEAIACGTPVVAVKEGGVRESMKEDDTALLVPRDAAAFAQALDSLRARPALWEHMSRRGREEALRFWDWKSAYHRFHDIVVNALGLSLN